MKNFFSNKIVKVVEWSVLALMSVGLVISGVSSEEISNGIAIASGSITGLSTIFAFISSKIK